MNVYYDGGNFMEWKKVSMKRNGEEVKYSGSGVKILT